MRGPCVRNRRPAGRSSDARRSSLIFTAATCDPRYATNLAELARGNRPPSPRAEDGTKGAVEVGGAAAALRMAQHAGTRLLAGSFFSFAATTPAMPPSRASRLATCPAAVTSSPPFSRTLCRDDQGKVLVRFFPSAILLQMLS